MRLPGIVLVVSALMTGCTSGGTPAPVTAPRAVVHECAEGGTDSDGDGLSDACEQRLAERFAPVLNASAVTCNALPAGDPRHLGGGYLFVVAPSGSRIRVAYLPAYFRDCGWSGAKCRLPGVDCSPHAGDSEMIVLELEGGPEWEVAGVFLSAHCFGRSSSSCRWYRGRELEAFRWAEVGGRRPIVWVANGRNANYPSRRSCEAGHWWVDTCAGARMEYRFPVREQANLGSRAAPGVGGGCVPAAEVDPAHAATAEGAVECFWDDAARFRGWQADGRGVTPYSRYLREIVEGKTD